MADDEDKWEYEYDKDESEVVYVTVDFSTHTPPSLPENKKSTKQESKNGPRKQARNAGNAVHETVDSTPSIDVDSQTPGQMQILDMHTSNPLISYNSQLYTCHWATDIGTTIHISKSKPDSDSSELHQPLRSFDSFDLLAKTRARLVAVPARVKPAAVSAPQAPAPTPALQFVSSTTGFVLDTTEGDRVVYEPDGRMRITVPANASAAKVSQSRFLERWAELNARRGKTDPVPIKTVKNYSLPDGWQEERRAWLAKGREEVLAAGKSPRRRRRYFKRIMPGTDAGSVYSRDISVISDEDEEIPDDAGPSTSSGKRKADTADADRPRKVRFEIPGDDISDGTPRQPAVGDDGDEDDEDDKVPIIVDDDNDDEEDEDEDEEVEEEEDEDLGEESGEEMRDK
ncbi:hypothetical protein ANO11243_037540 [Dothideomycetidae sp. 11243]|nr:hypothetical protein ANO11243_037540 [fungal sp. No.11243]